MTYAQEIQAGAAVKQNGTDKNGGSGQKCTERLTSGWCNGKHAPERR